MTFVPKLLGFACVCLMSMPLAVQATDGPLSLLSTTPLPDVTGGDFDHFAVDLPHHKLYVSAETYGSIEVFKLPDGQHLASYKGIAKNPHKIILADRGKELFIADAGDANVKIVDTKTFKIEDRIPLEPQPDSGVTDKKNGIFYLGNGGVQSHKENAYISIISIADKKILGRIDVPSAQLKAMVMNEATQRLFVNMREKDEIGVIDLKTRKLVAIWHVPGPSLNSAMAFDQATNRLFIGSRSPGKLFVLDASNGRVIQSLDIVDVSDDMTFDKTHHCLYVTGAGGLDVVRQRDADHYSIAQHLDTLGGKTAVYIPSLKKFYVVHTEGPQAAEAGLQIFHVE